MFGDRPVVADFSLTRGGSNSLIEDLACGTITYKDYQTIGASHSMDDLKKIAKFSTQDILKFKDEKPNFFQTDVFSLGAIMYEMYFNDDLISYYASEEKIYRQYVELESEIMHKITTRETDIASGKIKSSRGTKLEDDVKVLRCVLECVRHKLSDRIQHVVDILKCDVFADKVMSQPIPGRMVANYLPTKNWCGEVTSDINKPLAKITKILVNWCTEVLNHGRYGAKHKFLLTYVVFLTLFYRTYEINRDSSRVQLYGCIALYLAVAVTTEIPMHIDFLVDTSSGAFSKREFEMTLKEFVVTIKGVIRVPSIYDVTENATEIAWWITKALDDCKVIEQSPVELHNEYAELEAKNQKLFQVRIPKNLVKSFMCNPLTQKYKLVYYKSLDQYKDGTGYMDLVISFNPPIDGSIKEYHMITKTVDGTPIYSLKSENPI